MRSLAVALALLAASCGGPAAVASPTPAPSPLPLAELRYRVFEQVGRPWYCDPDFYPVARADEKELARQRLPEMQKDTDTYAAILTHNGIPAAATLSDDQLLAIYHDWKDLQRVPLDPTGPPGVYGGTFVVQPKAADKQSERVELRVETSGRVTVLFRNPAGPPNCPICLTGTTQIDTPDGSRPVAALRIGDLVWTADEAGRRIAMPIVEVGSVLAPLGHEVVRVVLGDGRSVTASPGHPIGDGRMIGQLVRSDALDGAAVIAVERLPYRGRTYDLLPAGPTGSYWADGVLLASTLHR